MITYKWQSLNLKKKYKVNMKKKTLQGITPCKIILQVKDLELEEIQLIFIIIISTFQQQKKIQNLSFLFLDD